MSLTVGTKLGPYEIVAPIGAGGMGEVYRARDIKLGRDVAIKVLPESFAHDAERMARFEREAQVLASLNHPNIATIYGLEESDGIRALVMELVEGPTLAERIGHRAMPLDEALPIAKQIAEGLEYAHERGIIHRDLKPANVKLTADGNVKILDFGLAKALETPTPQGNPSISPTLTLEGTRAGVILGTAAYMAPEQARGAVVDKRADIWAFGVVLYEMLTGKQPFAGATVSDTLAAVLKTEPDWDAVPSAARPLVRRCMDKDPKRRLRDIGEARLALEEGPEVEQPATPKRFLPWAIAAVLLLTTAALAFLLWRRGPHSGSSPVARLTMEITPAEELTGDLSGRPSRTAIAIAPDGNTVVFSARNPGAAAALAVPTPLITRPFKLYKRALDQMESVAIPGTEGAVGPFFDPDGQRVGFWAGGKLKKVSMGGGPAFTICDAPTTGTYGLWGASWSSADSIVFALPGGNLMQVPAKGGTPQVLIKNDPAKGEVYITPEFLPDGKTLLYTVRTSNNWADAQIVVRRLDTGEQHVLIQGGTDARYVPTGHLIYMQNAVLMAVPFDARRMQLAGPPVAMLDGVMQAVNEPNSLIETGMGQFSASASGNLIYAAGGIYPPWISTLLRVDRNGKETELKVPKGGYLAPRVSPDGRKLALFRFPETSRLSDIWVLDLLTGNGTRLTSQGTCSWPLWSPDGKRLLFEGGPGGTQILSIAADGSGAAETVFTGKGHGGIPASWSADGKLAYLELGEMGWQILTRSISGNGAPEAFSDSKFDYRYPQFSPDGRWMAYVSDETGQNEVCVRAFPGPGEKYPISAGGGLAPVWARNQRELFYLVYKAPGKVGMMAVDIAPGAAFEHGQPHQIFEGDYGFTFPVGDYDITPDGQHFIMSRSVPPPEHRITKLTVVLNWFDELRRRAPAGGK